MSSIRGLNRWLRRSKIALLNRLEGKVKARSHHPGGTELRKELGCELLAILETGTGRLTISPDITNKIVKIETMMSITSLLASDASAASSALFLSSASFCSGVISWAAPGFCAGNRVSMNFSISRDVSYMFRRKGRVELTLPQATLIFKKLGSLVVFFLWIFRA